MKKLFVEIADNRIKREKGLMHRKTIGKNEGMLFKFPHKHHMAFWMKDTYIPLDIAFLDDDGKIVQIEKMNPLSTRATRSNIPCRYAIEANQGWFDRNGVRVGNKIFNVKEFESGKKIVSAQVDVETLMGDEPTTTETPEEQEQPEVSQDVMLNRSTRQKIEHAELHGLPLLIVYRTLNGNVPPPRKLMPLPGEGYPIESGKNGYHFKALDVSPTIGAGGMEIEGNTPKSFIIDNVIGLEILDEGQTT